MSSSATPVRVLLVDDYAPWRESARSILANSKELHIAAEAADGLEAVQIAQALQPDLILLDIGLPKLNGIEVAGRIREISPLAKILLVSENRSQEIAQEALRTGAAGYVVKSAAGTELLPAIEAVLQGHRFLSVNLAGPDITEPAHQDIALPFHNTSIPPEGFKLRHEVAFYADDAAFLDGFARFIEAALKLGNAVIVVATESHQAELFQRLAADGLNVPAEIEHGGYTPLEVTKNLSSFMTNNSPNPVLFRKVAADLIREAAKGAKGEPRKVTVCGEGVQTLLAAGNLEATIMLERLWDEIARRYEVNVLCGYFRSEFATEEDISTLQRICAEHSAVHGRPLGY